MKYLLIHLLDVAIRVCGGLAILLLFLHGLVILWGRYPDAIGIVTPLVCRTTFVLLILGGTFFGSMVWMRYRGLIPGLNHEYISIPHERDSGPSRE